MPRVCFEDVKKEEDFPEGKTLLACALDMHIAISHVCGGEGACGTCRVEVVEGWDNLTSPTPDETYKELEPPYRLSCQAQLKGKVIVKVAKIE